MLGNEITVTSLSGWLETRPRTPRRKGRGA
jgi:hypothetical protein